MTRWEYRIDSVRNSSGGAEDLNKWGSEGWEVCGASLMHRDASLTIVLKRPIEEDQPISIVRRS